MCVLYKSIRGQKREGRLSGFGDEGRGSREKGFLACKWDSGSGSAFRPTTGKGWCNRQPAIVGRFTSRRSQRVLPRKLARLAAKYGVDGANTKPNSVELPGKAVP